MDSNRLPLYLALAQTLRQEIDAKQYKIGAHLPPEDQLVVKYGVSRHTVRQALRELKDEGLITSKAGIGTIVSSRSDAAQFFSGIKTISDLLQFVDATQMHVISQEEIIANAELSSQLHCHIGQAWSSIKILRKIPKTKLPLCFLQVFIWPEHADIFANRKVLNRPIYSLLEQKKDCVSSRFSKKSQQPIYRLKWLWHWMHKKGKQQCESLVTTMTAGAALSKLASGITPVVVTRNGPNSNHKLKSKTHDKKTSTLRFSSASN